MKKKLKWIFLILIVLLSTTIISNCNQGGNSRSSSAPAENYDTVDLTANWKAYNDCVDPTTGSNAFVTHHHDGDTGYLKDFSDGTDTSIEVQMSGNNLAPWAGTEFFQPGTNAHDTFDGIVNITGMASYNNGLLDWYYEANFNGLDPAKKYALVTTANRDNSSYDGDGASSRWTKFTISGADTYRNVSSAGATEVSEGVIKINTGYNTVNGYVVAWTDITAADGSFTVRSENVGVDGPGDENKSYGLQAFMFLELAE